MNELNLFSLFIVFGVMTLYAVWRNHWQEFGVLLTLTFFSGMGFIWRLLG